MAAYISTVVDVIDSPINELCDEDRPFLKLSLCGDDARYMFLEILPFDRSDRPSLRSGSVQTDALRSSEFRLQNGLNAQSGLTVLLRTS